MKFLIHATPRSGSTWLANFLTTPDCVVRHDPLGRMSLDEMLRDCDAAIDTGSHRYFSSTALVGIPQYALKRDHAEIKDSLQALNLPIVGIQGPLPLRTFTYEQMFDPTYLRGLWITVYGTDQGFSWDRARMLIDLNVQHRWDRILG